MKRPPRLTHQGLKVLKAFFDAYQENVRSKLSGADIMRRVSLSSGTVYPLLLRFEGGHLLESEWETEDPRDLERPRRRLYSLTPQGVAVIENAVREILPASFFRPNEA